MSIKDSRSAWAEPRPPGTGPAAACDHVTRLRQDGGNYRGIAASLAPAAVQGLLSGRRRDTSGKAADVVAVTSRIMPHGRVDAGGSRLRLRAL